jgi:hypothetical protein
MQRNRKPRNREPRSIARGTYHAETRREPYSNWADNIPDHGDYYSDGELRINAGSQALVFSKANAEVPAQEAFIEFSCDSFVESNHISLSWAPEIKIDDSLKVALCSDPTTGFRWTESAEISDQTVLKQISHTSAPSLICCRTSPCADAVTAARTLGCQFVWAKNTLLKKTQPPDYLLTIVFLARDHFVLRVSLASRRL